jgi:hypothetical protein
MFEEVYETAWIWFCWRIERKIKEERKCVCGICPCTNPVLTLVSSEGQNCLVSFSFHHKWLRLEPGLNTSVFTQPGFFPLRGQDTKRQNNRAYLSARALSRLWVGGVGNKRLKEGRESVDRVCSRSINPISDQFSFCELNGIDDEWMVWTKLRIVQRLAIVDLKSNQTFSVFLLTQFGTSFGPTVLNLRTGTVGVVSKSTYSTVP